MSDIHRLLLPGMSEYQAYFFDLYGTLIDIHTEEGDHELWEFMAKYYAITKVQGTVHGSFAGDMVH